MGICERRDAKGLYKQARAGQIAEFTGISSPCQYPENPELIVATGECELGECLSKVMNKLEQQGVINFYYPNKLIIK